MPPLHPKINPEHVHADGFLLAREARTLVAHIQADVKAFKASIASHLAQRADSELKLNELSAAG
ncbi:MAG: hypothetical protein P1U32_07485 [Legionellaceae bacterium]|nr:hypothetical protein [Legionellaceae bacterium]